MAFFGKAQDLVERHWESNSRPKSGTAEIEVLDRPPLRSVKPVAVPAHPTNDAVLAEYAELAALTGVSPPDLTIERFKAFLVRHDIPTFSLAEVVSYMDDRAAKESKDKCGWEWRPLREKDHRTDMGFGREASRTYENSNRGIITAPASDYYWGPGSPEERHHSTGVVYTYIRPPNATPYNRTIPIHALRKVALIEKEFGDTVGMFVSDYALAPQIQYPDPFLMAMIANPNVANGTGRFVIDFWDEPGFGIDKMIAYASAK